MNRINFNIIFLSSLVFLATSCAELLERQSIVFTGEVSNPTGSTAQALGTIVDLQGTTTQYGHVWGETPAPTVEGNKSELGATNEKLDFQSQLTGLTPNTTYFVRAYAIIGTEIVYGGVMTFSTTDNASGTDKPEIDVATLGIGSISASTATADGQIVNATNTTFTQHGHVWSTAANPEVGTASATELGPLGADNATWQSEVTGLAANTTYFIRAYADAGGNVTYGNEIQFQTASE